MLGVLGGQGRLTVFSRVAPACQTRSYDPLLHPRSRVEEACYRAARRDQFIAGRRQIITERHFQNGQQVLQLLQRARADQRRGDARLVFHPERRQLRPDMPWSCARLTSSLPT